MLLNCLSFHETKEPWGHLQQLDNDLVVLFTHLGNNIYEIP